MNAVVWTYVIYLVLSLILTIWVAHTLHKNGRIFLVDAFQGNAALADSVNHLLVVGFYLVNIGFISFVLKTTEKIESVQVGFEILSGKMGSVLLALGVMHFFNLLVFSKMRRKGRLNQLPPPVPASGTLG
jgi:hypothetical protein